MERRETECLDRVDRHPTQQQEFHSGQIATRRGRVQRRVAVVVARIDVRSVVEQARRRLAQAASTCGTTGDRRGLLSGADSENGHQKREFVGVGLIMTDTDLARPVNAEPTRVARVVARVAE